MPKLKIALSVSVTFGLLLDEVAAAEEAVKGLVVCLPK